MNLTVWKLKSDDCHFFGFTAADSQTPKKTSSKQTLKQLQWVVVAAGLITVITIMWTRSPRRLLEEPRRKRKQSAGAWKAAEDGRGESEATGKSFAPS